MWPAPGRWDEQGTPGETADDVWVHGDYHLKSEAGRRDDNAGQWVIDGVTSPCLDAGDPTDAADGELYPNGGAVNMGRYGGTLHASLSVNAGGRAADLDFDGPVTLADFAMLASDWARNSASTLAKADGPPYRGDLNRDGTIDLKDLSVFAEAWLQR
jgi:hypothetical protein